MAQNEIKYPEANYKIVTVGPSRDWSFKGDDGNDINMRSYSLQLEGVAEWVDLAQKPDTEAPKADQTLEGHVEDTGKFGYKFVKKKQGRGGFGGGGKNFAGAAWANAVQSAIPIVTAYYQLTGTKPANPGEIMTRIEDIAPKVKAMVDKFAGTEAPAAGQQELTKENLGTGNPDDPIAIDDVDEKELDWK